MIKYLIVAVLGVWSSQAFSDDIDLYVKNTGETAPRPSVLIILDNSPSMVWYDMNGVYLSDRQVNNPDTRAHKARKIVIDLINKNPDVDFALQLFNSNSNSSSNPRHGGRIVFGFQDLSIPANKDALIKILDNDTNNTNNNYTTFNGNGTPLCETLYETYRYLSGGNLYYGNDDTSTPKSIISSGKYTSPFSGIKCNKEVTIIYITDGDPTIDDNANSLVKTLTGAKDSDAEGGNFLNVLGKWMAERNWLTGAKIKDTPDTDVLASVKIHTVGFGGGVNATTLLKLAAREGAVVTEKSGFYSSPQGGEYHPATTADALEDVLNGIIEEVMGGSILTSASVSANNMDYTKTLDEVYYGMFEPSNAARWQGNLKKYKITNGVQVDANGKPAVNAAGDFAEKSQSFWSVQPASEFDGDDVVKGGVADMLRNTLTSARNLLTDIGGTGTLSDFGETEIKAKNPNVDDYAALFGVTLAKKNEISVVEKNEISDHIKWAKGIDVDDDDDNPNTLVRPDVFGDPLHSKPIVVRYDSGNSHIVVGTNAGVLHMFEDDVNNNKVIEKWAYLPKEFFKNIKPLRQNAITVNNKIYGLDGEITLHINDLNQDGVVDKGSDTAWIFFGVRRGGTSYYAIDITTPDSPKLMWRLDEKNLADLGQTWSKPQVIRSKYNISSDGLVVVFGGGYDTKKDAAGPNAHEDTKGAIVYMVDALTGTLIKEIPTGGKNGIAASIATLDSDRDGYADRLYAADTGGNVWRIDMPDADPKHTSLIKLASLGGTTDADDRRFFNTPNIVRTYILETIDTGTKAKPNIIKQEIPYDAILLGSGDRATPTATDTNDTFFMIKDKYITTDRLDTFVPAIDPITMSTLYDYSDDPFKGYPLLTDLQKGKLLEASLHSGWYFDLRKSGEKSTAEARVINNVVYFNSYSPATAQSCSVTPGDAWFYAIDLSLGFAKYSWGSEPGNTRGDRIRHVGSQYTGTPTLIVTDVLDPKTGKTESKSSLIVENKVIDIPFELQTIRTSLSIQENF